MNEEHERSLVAMKATAGGMMARARSFPVTDQESLTKVNAFLVAVNTFIKEAKNYWAPLYDKAKANLDEVRRMRDDVLDEAEGAKAMAKKSVAAYLQKVEEERIAKESEAFAEEQARIRKAREAEEALELAGMAEQMGDKAGAEELLALAVKNEREAAAVPATPVPLAPVLDGIHRREHYSYEVLDDSKLPREYIKIVVDLGKIRRAVDEKKMAANIPGVLRVYRDDIIVNR